MTILKKETTLLFYSSFKKWYTNTNKNLGSNCVRITIKDALPSWRSISFYKIYQASDQQPYLFSISNNIRDR